VLWDMRTGRQLGAPLVGHASGVPSSAFSPDGRMLATVDGDAMLWDVATHKQLGAALPIRSQGHTPWPSGSKPAWGGRSERLGAGVGRQPHLVAGARLRRRGPHPDPSRVRRVPPWPTLQAGCPA
jgi:hypothetical protein